MAADMPVIITVGLTGSRISRQQTPHIPITPREIARSGIEAWRAGASVVHVHVRDATTGLGTQDVAVFKEVVDRLRAETDAILCLTTSGIPGRNLSIEERLAPLACGPRWRRSTPVRSTPKPASFSTTPSSSTPRPPRPASTASSSSSNASTRA